MPLCYSIHAGVWYNDSRKVDTNRGSVVGLSHSYLCAK
uniref:Integrator complex subunit 7 n=1 Tax=Mesocestoides corti TaxID=53468 RepID=A0A5K3F073_MESCO